MEPKTVPKWNQNYKTSFLNFPVPYENEKDTRIESDSKIKTKQNKTKTKQNKKRWRHDETGQNRVRQVHTNLEIETLHCVDWTVVFIEDYMDNLI